jgi:hypothetical protein
VCQLLNNSADIFVGAFFSFSLKENILTVLVVTVMMMMMMMMMMMIIIIIIIDC